jgi:hypothetical protein
MYPIIIIITVITTIWGERMCGCSLLSLLHRRRRRRRRHDDDDHEEEDVEEGKRQ